MLYFFFCLLVFFIFLLHLNQGSNYHFTFLSSYISPHFVLIDFWKCYFSTLCIIKDLIRINLGGPSRWQRSEMWRSPSSPQIHHKYIDTWNNSYRTPTERWQKTSDFPKGKKIPTYLGRAKEKRKNRDKRIGTGPVPLGGSCEGGKVSTHYEAPSLVETGGWAGGKLRSHGGERSHRGAEGKAERFPHRGSVPTSTHQPERLVCSPARAGGAGS